MLTCLGCGRWMHTEGIDESYEVADSDCWMVRSECRGCGLMVGAVGRSDEVSPLVDRLLWTDDAQHQVDRMPPYLACLLVPDVEAYARSHGKRLVTLGLLQQARQGGVVDWEPEAEQRLNRVPAGVRTMAKLELERTALDRGQTRVTIALMEEVKARYFGMAGEARGQA